MLHIMVHEVELKLTFPAAALSRILRHPLIAHAPKLGRAQTLVNTYYDTPDLDLQRARVAVRTRKAGRTWLQTVKCAAESVGGLASRPEWEQTFGGSFDFSAVDAPEARKLLDQHLAHLKPLFTTEFRRETRVAEPMPGVRILMMIDTGVIRAEDRESPICELELELESGAASDLLDLALQLATDLPLLPFDPSKAERGYQLFHNQQEKPLKAGASPVCADWTPLQAFRALALRALAMWQANLHGAMAWPEPGFVHQMRISLRRLRTMMRVFEPILPAGFADQWSATFATLASGVGDARDLDVLRATILQPVLDAEDGKALEELARRAAQASVQARQRAQDRLADPAQGVALLGFMKALHALEDTTGEQAMVPYARGVLRRLRKRARSRLAEAVAQGSTETLHQLRIALKHLRYASEFFAPLFKEKAMTRFVADIASLQDELGFLNDLAVARQRLAEWAGDDIALLEARAFVGGWHAPRAARLKEALIGRTESLLGGKAPWRKTR